MSEQTPSRTPEPDWKREDREWSEGDDQPASVLPPERVCFYCDNLGRVDGCPACNRVKAPFLPCGPGITVVRPDPYAEFQTEEQRLRVEVTRLREQLHAVTEKIRELGETLLDAEGRYVKSADGVVAPYPVDEIIDRTIAWVRRISGTDLD